MSKAKTISLFTVYGFLISMFFWIISINDFHQTDVLCLTTFFLNGIIWIALLLKEIGKKAYSLTIIHWVFCIFFFFVAAIAQFAVNKFPWIKVRNNEIILQANVFLLIWTFCFWLGNLLAKKTEHKQHIKMSTQDYDPSKKTMNLITLGSFLILLSRIRTLGITGLFIKSAVDNMEQSGSGDSAIKMLVEKVMLSYCCISTLLSILLSKKIKTIDYLQ